MRVELAVAEAEADVQRAPQIAHAGPVVQGEAVHAPTVEGVPMDCEENGIATCSEKDLCAGSPHRALVYL